MTIEDKLKNLRRSMTTTTFKDVDVDKQKLKNSVLERSRQSRFTFHYDRLKKWYVSGLSVAGIVLLIFFIGVTSFLDQFPGNSGQYNSEEMPDGEGPEQLYNAPNNNDRKESLVVSKEYPGKFKIVNKMFHSLDYIENAYGKFEWGYPKENTTVKQEFYFDFNTKNSLSQVKHIKNGKVEETEIALRNEERLIRKLKEKNVFTKVASKEIGRGLEHEKQNYLAASSFVTNSEWFTLIYKNYEDWTYEEGRAFGMPVYMIEGTISENKSESLAGPFTMIVSKETGALLDLKCYDYEDSLKFFITVDNIQINQGVAKEIFKLDVDGSKQLSWDDYFHRTRASKGVKKGMDEGRQR